MRDEPGPTDDRDGAPAETSPKRGGRRRHKRAFLGSILTVGLGNASGQAILVLSSPIVSRIFGPADFGVSAVLISLVLVITAFATFKYELVLVAASEPRDQANAIALVLGLLTTSTAILTVGLGGIWGYAALTDVELSWLHPILVLAPAALLFAALDSMLVQKVLIRFGEFRRLSVATVVGGLVTAVTQIGLGLSGLGAWGLVLGRIAGHGAAVAIMLVTTARRILALLREHATREGIIALARLHYRQAIYLSPAAGLLILSAQLPVFLLAPTFGAAAAGAYFFGNTLATAGLTVYRQTVPGLTLREAARRREAGQRVLPFLMKLTAVVSAPAFAVALVLFFYATPLMVIIFGEQWRLAGEMMEVMGFTYASKATFSAASAPVSMLNAQWQNLVTQAVRVAGSAVAILIGAAYDDLFLAITLLSASNVLVSAVSIGFIFRRAHIEDVRAATGGA